MDTVKRQSKKQTKTTFNEVYKVTKLIKDHFLLWGAIQEASLPKCWVSKWFQVFAIPH